MLKLHALNLKDRSIILQSITYQALTRIKTSPSFAEGSGFFWHRTILGPPNPVSTTHLTSLGAGAAASGLSFCSSVDMFSRMLERRECRKKIESLFPDAVIDRSVGPRRRCWGYSGDTGHHRYRIDFLLGINQITGKRDRNILIISFTPRFVRDF